MNIEGKFSEVLKEGFPKYLKEEELIELGAKKIKGMTYYQLENSNKTKIGIYEPSYKRKKIIGYNLRKHFEFKKIFD